jgi:hypothetical protein
MRRLTVALFLALVGLGLAGSLSACVIDDGGGWHHHWH